MASTSVSRRLLNYYNAELQYLREMGEAFALEYPKVAGRLGLDAFECADPYVERLLEGVSFLTARVRMKLDDEFPRFTQSLLESVYPQYLCPTPSMAIVRFEPDPSEPSLSEGVPIPRGSVLRSGAGIGDESSCEYRTGHDTTLWPVEVLDAQYYTRDISSLGLPETLAAEAGVRLRLRTTGGQRFDELALDRLVFHVRGGGNTGARIYAQLFKDAQDIVIRSAPHDGQEQHVLSTTSLQQVGFSNEEALLPYNARSFHGYRLLQEYFVFPERFMFFELGDLAAAIAGITASELDLFILFAQPEPRLENEVGASNFVLHCTPAMNLFPKEPDRIPVSDGDHDYHVVPDRTRPLDFEVYEIQKIIGYGATSENPVAFEPFYASHGSAGRGRAFFSVNRVPRRLTEREISFGPRSSYAGSELYVSLVDDDAAPFSSDIRQLSLRTLCTNRDLPLLMHLGHGPTDFTMDLNAPVLSVSVLGSPTTPRHSHAEGDLSWRIINHLSLNYLSLLDTEGGDAAAAVRELLNLYGESAEPGVRKQIDSIRSVGSRPITRRVLGEGQIAFARGLEVAITFEDDIAEGAETFLLGAVLDRFFAKYVSLNSFTETVVCTTNQGELKRWTVRKGERKLA